MAHFSWYDTIEPDNSASSPHFNEIFQQYRTFEREETLRMELHAVKRPNAMADAHDLVFVGPGGDDEVWVFEGFAFDDKAMIARRGEGVGHALKNALAIVIDGR